ncbi:MAG: winged helix-turn-helix domain-containing protein [Chloroflexi bacterium]|nr:winged helix-turn-helix domain-containing protein [Chloroflexota bacterium]
MIHQKDGIEVSLPAVGRLLRACPWRLQKPARRARQRDEPALRAWGEERWCGSAPQPQPWPCASLSAQGAEPVRSPRR